MDDFSKKFIDVHRRAHDEPDFEPERASWWLDQDTWVWVLKSRLGYEAMSFTADGRKLFFRYPVALVATRDLREIFKIDRDVKPDDMVPPEPALICITYPGMYGFSRYVVSTVADAKFRQFDTTGLFRERAKAP